jgi:hypothetical protein
MYNKRKKHLVIYVSSGCKFLFSRSHSHGLLLPNPLPPSASPTVILSERIVMHHHSFMYISVRKAAPTHDVSWDAMAMRWRYNLCNTIRRSHTGGSDDMHCLCVNTSSDEENVFFVRCVRRGQKEEATRRKCWVQPCCNKGERSSFVTGEN